jgi:ABC-type bacteriocin/lantibiotic exporter with double-glycine peptidase domain
MRYEVEGMQLIPQTQTMSCWYASAQMLIQWRRHRRQMSEMGIVDPSEDPASAKLRDDNTGIVNPTILALAERLGLRPVPPMSPTPAAIKSWLQQYGPLWVNGKSHIVVLAGIDGDQVKVYDPAPLNKGRIEWRSLRGWYIGSSSSSRDSSRDVQAVFLHLPS